MARKNQSGSLAFQIKTEFDKKLAIGESKYQDKILDKTQDKIYSWETYRTYLKHTNYFAKWVKEEHQCKTLEQAKPYINQYLQARENQNLSAYTLKLEKSALAKLYQIDSKELYQTKDRSRSDITRSRGERVRDKNFNEEQNRDLVDFCRGTGLRRGELKQIKGSDLVEKNEKFYLEVSRGTKGGRPRTVEIVGNVDKIVSMLKNAQESKLFPSPNSNADIHSYRQDYCKSIYEKYARPLETLDKKDIYVCRKDRKGEKFDKDAMKIASECLGHSRVEVIAGHYLLGD